MSQRVIDSFQNEYYFLSNFYPCSVTYRGITYPSSEAAFHAQKTFDVYEQLKFTRMTPSESKRAGRKIALRPDWEDVKYHIMHEIVLQKFLQNEDLRLHLLSTGEYELVEGNWWNDTFWGVCNGEGKNSLGHILMDVREYLRTLRTAMLNFS